MAYTIQDLEKEIAEVHEPRRSEIRRDRGKRYGDPADTLSNISVLGWWGAAMQLHDCAKRLINMVKEAKKTGMEPAPEDVLNAADDAANYATYVAVLLNRERSTVANVVEAIGRLKADGHLPSFEELMGRTFPQVALETPAHE
jgi:hypothetical protein